MMTRKIPEHTLHDYVQLTLEDYFHQLDNQPPSKVYAMVIAEVEKALFKSVLAYAKNNKSLTSDYLGLSRGTLRKKLREYNLDAAY